MSSSGIHAGQHDEETCQDQEQREHKIGGRTVGRASAPEIAPCIRRARAVAHVSEMRRRACKTVCGRHNHLDSSVIRVICVHLREGGGCHAQMKRTVKPIG